jgi:hypothetical protein
MKDYFPLVNLTNLREIYSYAFRSNWLNISRTMLTPLVAVMMTRSVGFMVTILGILKVGVAYVPPGGQFYIFSHSKCQLLVADHDSYRSAVTLGAELPSFIIVDSFTGEVDFATLPRIKKAEDFDWNDVKNDIPVEVTRET